MAQDLVSIIIPHYNTPVELNLCLDCLRHYTGEETEILVVDNGSPQQALSRIRLPSNARLLERQQESMDQEPHKAALDMAIEQASGKLVVALHSDSFVLHERWLRFLRECLRGDLMIAGPSSHKLYPPTFWERWKVRLKKRQEEIHRIRPVFTIYRREVFEKAGFSDFKDVGDISLPYLEAGRARLLSREEVLPYVFHLGGTTRLSNLQHRRKASKKKSRQTEAFLRRPEVRRVLEASSSTEESP